MILAANFIQIFHPTLFTPNLPILPQQTVYFISEGFPTLAKEYRPSQIANALNRVCWGKVGRLDVKWVDVDCWIHFRSCTDKSTFTVSMGVVLAVVPREGEALNNDFNKIHLKFGLTRFTLKLPILPPVNPYFSLKGKFTFVRHNLSRECKIQTVVLIISSKYFLGIKYFFRLYRKHCVWV